MDNIALIKNEFNTKPKKNRVKIIISQNMIENEGEDMKKLLILSMLVACMMLLVACGGVTNGEIETHLNGSKT